jgi:hypothetical protein
MSAIISSSASWCTNWVENLEIVIELRQQKLWSLQCWDYSVSSSYHDTIVWCEYWAFILDSTNQSISMELTDELIDWLMDLSWFENHLQMCTSTSKRWVRRIDRVPVIIHESFQLPVCSIEVNNLFCSVLFHLIADLSFWAILSS